ncbi:MAG: LysR family transcriptional regulator [Ruminococcus sp.]|jgi:DNA-binding transcriptional LysR family regulator
MEQNLSLYRIFYTVANTGSISRAASELYISQPAVSKAVQKLEQSLNTALFTRSSRGVSLTEEGNILYDHVKNAFSSIQAGEEKLKQMRELDMGHIRIGVSTTLCRFTLLPFLETFIRTHPHVRITIECQSSNRTLQLLTENKIDLGLIGRPEHLHQVRFHPLGEIEDILVATRSYLDNLHMRGSDLFQNANLMLLDKENITRQYMDEYLALNRISTENALEISTMDLLIEFARIGLGIACVIKQFVTRELESGELIEIPLDIPVQKREIGFACRKQPIKNKAVREFLSLSRTASDP